MVIDRQKLWFELLDENPDMEIRHIDAAVREVMQEIRAIESSFEKWPVNFGWRIASHHIHYL